MRKLILYFLVVATLSSCAFESYECHSYGNTNGHTKHGHKAQKSYGKRKI